MANVKIQKASSAKELMRSKRCEWSGVPRTKWQEQAGCWSKCCLTQKRFGFVNVFCVQTSVCLSCHALTHCIKSFLPHIQHQRCSTLTISTHKLWVLNHSSIISPCVLWHSKQQSINQSVPHIVQQTCVTMTVFCSTKMHFSTSKTHGMCHECILIVNKQWAMFVVFTNAQPTTVTQNMIQSNCKKLCTTCNVSFLAFYSPPSVSPTHFFRSLLQILAQRAALMRQGIIPDTHLLCPWFCWQKQNSHNLKQTNNVCVKVICFIIVIEGCVIWWSVTTTKTLACNSWGFKWTANTTQHFLDLLDHMQHLHLHLHFHLHLHNKCVCDPSQCLRPEQDHQ